MKDKIIIYSVLVISFLILSFVYLYSKSNITVITYTLPDSSISHKVFDEFTQGRKISGEFSPKENYLGQVLIRFYNYNRINTDSLTFRIKEKGASSWYYENSYKTDQFLPDNLFTFGFPIIPNSKGKIYDFEVVSLNGTPEESVSLSRVSPLAALSFQYPKTLLVKNPKLAVGFLESKIKYQEINNDVIFSFLIYLDFIILILLLEFVLLRAILENKLRLNSSAIIVVALVIMVFSSILLYLKKDQLSETISVWAFFLLVAGVIKATIELRKEDLHNDRRK